MSAPAPARARLLGVDATGTFYYHFEALEGRVYSLEGAAGWGVEGKAGARRAAESVAPPPVREGEKVEVEVEEGGKVEWRRALVNRMLRASILECDRDGRAGCRFIATVLLPNGIPDDDFVEVYDGAQQGTEWRKVAKAAKPSTKAAKAAAKQQAARQQAPKAPKVPREGERRGRSRGGSSAATEPPAAAAAEPPAAAAAAAEPPAAASPSGARGGASSGAPAAAAVETAAERPLRLAQVDAAPLLARLKNGKGQQEKSLVRALQSLEPAAAEGEVAQERKWSTAAVRLMQEVLFLCFLSLDPFLPYGRAHSSHISP